MNFLHFIILLCATAILLLLGNVMLSQSAYMPLSSKSEQIMPSFVLNDLNGAPRHSEEWRNKILIINFWASWCPPCVREIPLFVKLQHKYANQVQFIGIALEQHAAVANFVRKQEINYPILLGGQQGTSLARNLGNQRGGLPFTVFIDKQGNIVAQHLGELFEMQLERSIQAILRSENNAN